MYLSFSTPADGLGEEARGDGVETIILCVGNIDLMLESDLHHLVYQYPDLLPTLRLRGLVHRSLHSR